MNENNKIGEMFTNLQNQMIAQFNTNRAFINHSVTKGDSFENIWKQWLRTYLPSRYCIDKAIIIDSEGTISDQIDLVIYDQQYTPFVFKQDEAIFIPAEGVYAVFEVKPKICGNIEYAGKKIESVRKLKRTSVEIINAGIPNRARPLTKILGGILTISNGYSEGDNSTIETHLKSLQDLQTIEIGCIVDYGAFYVNFDGKEDENEKDFQKRIFDYYQNRSFNKVTFSDKDNSLVTFFLQLTRYLQQAIGTIAAIDLNEYAKNVGFKIDDEI